MIIGAADENFFPRLGVSRSEIVAIGELVDFFRRQLREEVARQIAQQGIAQAIDAFEMFEKQDQPLEMRGGRACR